MSAVPASVPIDAVDRAIIAATQAGLPLVPEPYSAVAEQVGVPPAEVMARLRRMQEAGIVRRIGVVPNHYRLGFRANGMSVWDIPDEHLREVGHEIGGLAAVSHCYARPRRLPEWPYNLFAMLHGTARDEVRAQAERIAERLGERVRRWDVLFSTEILKKTGFRITNHR